jgi:protein FAM50
MRGGGGGGNAAPPLDGYVGSSHDAEVVRRQQQERELEREKFKARQAALEAAASAPALRDFGAAKNEAAEAAFKSETVGLVTRAEFVAKRDTMAERLEQELREKKEREAATAAAGRRAAAASSAAAAKRAGGGRPKLSFADDDDEEEEEEEEDEEGKEEAKEETNKASLPPAKKPRREPPHGGDDPAPAPPPPPPQPRPLGKDPSAPNTACLPDRDRQRREQQLRAELAAEFAREQARLRASPLQIVYSFWDGTGHRRRLTVRRGDTIGQFLKAAREQLAPQFRELRAVGADALLFVKEDVILPPHHTFHDLIASKARGKSGPLHEFGVAEDLRAEGDARQESRDVHAGKVVERHWYERNKHVHPYSRWEVWDPENQAKYAAPYRIGG